VRAQVFDSKRFSQEESADWGCGHRWSGHPWSPFPAMQHALLGSIGCPSCCPLRQGSRSQTSDSFNPFLARTQRLCGPPVFQAQRRPPRRSQLTSMHSRGGGQRCRAVQSEDPIILPPASPAPGVHRLEIDLDGQKLAFETGEIGRLAGGAVMASLGGTVIYTTACSATSSADDGDFMPLSVHYAERYSSAGKTRTGFIKRDGRPQDMETLVSRLVDRSLRPAFPPGWGHDTQVLQWVMSYDGASTTEPLAITAASAALAVSDIPLKSVVAGARVALLPTLGLVVNPTAQQLEESALDLVIAGTEAAVLMIEGFCNLLPEEKLLEAIKLGHNNIAMQCKAISEWAARVGKEKRSDFAAPSTVLDDFLLSALGTDIKTAYLHSGTKQERATAMRPVRQNAYDIFVHLPDPAAVPSDTGTPKLLDAATVKRSLKRVEASIMRSLVTQENFRADGRSTTEVRPITSRAGGFLPYTHGCALFTRGETQALAVATLGSVSSAQRLQSATAEDDDLAHFYLQYFFPPSCTGETGRMGAAGRREIGHGKLAERALAPVVPEAEHFAYTIRLESTITESNGSSSMASVCGGCLAMLDAGVPLLDSVAGVAMGLILEPDGKHTILTDILGSEDALGDMDFKVAGTADAVTAFQMDIKVEGITLEVMEKALAQARDARRSILVSMEACSPPPRRALGENAPCIARMQIPKLKVGAVKGPGGRTILALEETPGCIDIKVTTDRQFGWVEIVAENQTAMNLIKQQISDVTTDLQAGTIYRNAKVTGVHPYGCFIECFADHGGLVQKADLDIQRTLKPEDVWMEGDYMDVICLVGGEKARFSRKEVQLIDADRQGEWEWPNGRSTEEQSPEDLERGMVRKRGGSMLASTLPPLPVEPVDFFGKSQGPTSSSLRTPWTPSSPQ